MENNRFELNNGLYLCVDWLSFTLTSPCKMSDAIEILGYDMSDFRVLQGGANGYSSRVRHCIYSISILFDGTEEMGVHVDISGSAISDVLTHFYYTRLVDTPFRGKAYLTSDFDVNVLRDLLDIILRNGHVTRFDLAVDDVGARFYTLKQLHTLLSDGCYVSKFRKWKELITYTDSNVITGYTIYLGSRQSDIMLRVYDKQLEQNSKLVACGELPILYKWVRWELELKQNRAQEAAQKIINNISVQEVCIGVIANYLRIIKLDNERKTRCSTDKKWQKFLNGIASMSLYNPERKKTLDDTKRWLQRQVAPSLSAVIQSESGDMDFVYNLLMQGDLRLKQYQIDLIREAMQ